MKSYQIDISGGEFGNEVLLPYGPVGSIMATNKATRLYDKGASEPRSWYLPPVFVFSMQMIE